MLNYKFIATLLLGFSVLFNVARASDFERLVEAEALRLSDQKRAGELMSEINPDNLPLLQKQTYQYLKAYFRLYSGEFEEALADNLGLLQQVSNPALRLKIKSSILNAYIALNRWQDGILLSNDMLEEFADITDPNLLAYFTSISTFYYYLGDYETALLHVERLLPVGVPADSLCILLHLKIDSNYKLYASEGVSATEYANTNDVCEKANNRVMQAIVNRVWAQVLLDREKPKEALKVLDDTQQLREEANYVLEDLYTKTVYAEAYLQLSDFSMAEQYARDMLAHEASHSYSIGRIRALNVLWQALKQQQAFDEALSVFEQYVELKQKKTETDTVKLRIIQQVNADIAAKEADIERLDQQNRLLRTEKDLATERIENSILAFILLSTLLTILMFWSYRGRKLQKRFEYLAKTDGLTGINNRSEFIEQGTQMLQKAHKRFAPVSLILLDLDKFKHVNDTYGHKAGDDALQLTVKSIEALLDTSMLFARMGGEEFAILKVGYAQDQAAKFAEHCREALERIDTKDTGHNFKITASFGVTDSTLAGYKLDTLLASADLALYQSKHFGRNQVFKYNARLAQ
ncbi:GGDEF domain-containing protein [Alteromonas facilis]|uniref:GGDEF domain-containing protein n=1 Tax=Alteromonas facilis TaxID=2048004 RepID=UPI000C2932F1|nr:GGDEF domain-containing protein [Alteromonas facilis]